MRLILPALLLFLLVPSPLPAQSRPPSSAARWEKSIVRLEISRKAYDYYQPWVRRTGRTLKSGLVVGDREILTTSRELSDSTLVRAQKDGRGKWTQARITWVDYHANLALITVDDDSFWPDLNKAALATKPPDDAASLQILRWREGKLENRLAEFSQFAVRESEFSSISHVQLEMNSEIQAAGWGEPVVADSHVVGIVSDQSGRECKAIPATFIQTILKTQRGGVYRGLGYFHFYWQRADNTATLAHLRLPGEPRGVLVIHVPERLDGLVNVLKPQDIILEIDGFAVDMQGDYLDPDFGPLMLENLANRGKWAGDDVKLKIWRGGRPLEVTYRLPRYEYSHQVVPAGIYDQEPEYLILGGLVFQPLTQPYLERWGGDWQRRAPFRLNYFTGDEATAAQPAVLVLSQVLPDPYNLGYQEQRYQILKRVNHRNVSTLVELREALQTPAGDFHILEFLPNESVQRIVLDAGAAEREATRRVLQRYGIEEEFFIAAKPGGR